MGGAFQAEGAAGINIKGPRLECTGRVKETSGRPGGLELSEDER